MQNSEGDDHEIPDFGWWPEFAGLLLTAAMIGFFFWGATG